MLDCWIVVPPVSTSVAVVRTEDESFDGREVLSLFRKCVDDIESLREAVEDMKDMDDEISDIVEAY